MQETHLPTSEYDEKLEKMAARAMVDAYATQNPQCSVDYSNCPEFQNVALYTPALSQGYINTITRLGKHEKEARAKGDAKSDPLDRLSFGADDLKFINPGSKLCFYPWVLYSGGQGAKTDEKASQVNWVTDKPARDPKVVVIGDSGGFQIQQQTIPFDPQSTPRRMLGWLEATADQSMILDFPTGGIATGAMVPHVERLKQSGEPIAKLAKQHGFSEGYIACLRQTEINNVFFQQNRNPQATNLLNVIQGRNEAESAFWYERVKHFSQSAHGAFEGWAFAGKHSVQLSMTLRRLIQMRDDNLLQPDQFIHFLGVSTLKVGVALTFIQRALREHTDAHAVQLTFDSKSPVDAMSNGYQAFSGYDFSKDRWSIRTQPSNIAGNEGSTRPLRTLALDWVRAAEQRLLGRSSLGNMLTLGDLVASRDPTTGKRIPNALQQVLLVHHNTQAQIEAFREAYTYLEPRHLIDRPSSIQALDEVVQLIFRTEAPMSLIQKLEGRSGTPLQVIEDLRNLPNQPYKTIEAAQDQLDALAYEGVFGK